MARARTVVAAVLVVSLAACSGSDGAARDDDRGDETTMTTIERPDGPVAELTPLTGGEGVNLVSSQPVDLEAVGYVEEEYAASGTAISYRAVGEPPADGTMELEPDATAAFVTRLVVRRPAQAADFNGTVLQEWLNVSGGIDAAPDWTYGAAEIVRGGYAWVGVSVQQVGVQGGAAAIDIDVAPKGGVKAADPVRYGDLTHPGDAFSFDMFTQVARAIRAGGEVLGSLRPEQVLAIGQSQSAYMLTTYVNGVQPLTEAFDGFLVHSRLGAGGGLGEPGQSMDLASAIGGPGMRIRTDGEAPVLILQMEGDTFGVLGYFRARQDDTDTVRLWEVAGSSHADAFITGGRADLLGCRGQVNDGPQRFLVRTALRRLDAWVREGAIPPASPRIEADESGVAPVARRDPDGNALGGIRTPLLDVPVAVLSGDPADTTNIVCILFGRTEPFSAERLRDLYPSTPAYLDAYTASTDEAIEAGWILEEDREELLGMAAAEVT